LKSCESCYESSVSRVLLVVLNRMGWSLGQGPEGPAILSHFVKGINVQ
jgi:hypothetical protein